MTKAKPINGETTPPTVDGRCDACTCAKPIVSGVKGASGLPMCKCGHIVQAHAGHGVPNLLHPERVEYRGRR